MGRFNKLPSPLITISFLLNARIGANMRMPRPLSPQLTTMTDERCLVSRDKNEFVLSTNNSPLTIDHWHPNAFITPSAALSSLEYPGFLIMLFAALSNAAAHARCIELLEAGACIVPFNIDG